MSYTEETIRTAGARLFSRSYETPSCSGEVIVVHGFAEHSGRYGALVDHLRSKAYSVTVYDQRGHGRSEGLRGHIDRFDIYEDDLDAVVSHVRSRSLATRITLIGHSLGGLIALRYLARGGEQVRGAVISAPLLRVAVAVPPAKVLIARVAASVAPRLRMKNEIDPLLLSRDAAVGDAYAMDPLVGKLVSARWFVEAVRAMKEAMEWAPRVTVPLLVMHGTLDRLASVEATEEFFSRAGSIDKQLNIYPGYYHELFNEPEKQRLFEQVTGWLARPGGMSDRPGSDDEPESRSLI
jgi:lysophospholipase